MMKKKIVLVSFFLCMALPAAGVAAETASQPEAGNQRAACDAGCRENYQNNSAAMQACLRDCGAIGPASPQGAMAPAHEAAHTVQQSAGVKGSKSNSSERQAAPDTDEMPPVEPEGSPPEDGYLKATGFHSRHGRNGSFFPELLSGSPLSLLGPVLHKANDNRAR